MLNRVVPFAFVLLWSSSFVAAKTGLRHLTPLLFVAVRMAACAAVLVLLMLILRQSWRPLARGKWVHAAVAGALINGMGLMGGHVGLTMAPAAQIALVQSLTPLLTAALAVVLLREHLRGAQWFGLVLGFAGVALVVGQAAMRDFVEFRGLVIAFVGVIGIVAGTLYFGRFCRDIALLPCVTVQFLSAATVSAISMAVFEVPRAEWTGPTIAAVAWNTVMVSLGGMGLYCYMLARGSAARTTANFYLVPGTVAVLAFILLGEGIGLLPIAGLIVASAGCWLVSAKAGLSLRGLARTVRHAPADRQL